MAFLPCSCYMVQVPEYIHKQSCADFLVLPACLQDDQGAVAAALQQLVNPMVAAALQQLHTTSSSQETAAATGQQQVRHENPSTGVEGVRTHCREQAVGCKEPCTAATFTKGLYCPTASLRAVMTPAVLNIRGGTVGNVVNLCRALMLLPQPKQCSRHPQDTPLSSSTPPSLSLFLFLRSVSSLHPCSLPGAAVLQVMLTVAVGDKQPAGNLEPHSTSTAAAPAGECCAASPLQLSSVYLYGRGPSGLAT